MTQAAPSIPAQSLASIIELLYRVVAAQIAGRRLAGPPIILICSRLRRIAGRLASIAARLQAGKLRRRAAAHRQPAGAAETALPDAAVVACIVAWRVADAPDAGCQLPTGRTLNRPARSAPAKAAEVTRPSAPTPISNRSVPIPVVPSARRCGTSDAMGLMKPIG